MEQRWNQSQRQIIFSERSNYNCECTLLHMCPSVFIFGFVASKNYACILKLNAALFLQKKPKWSFVNNFIYCSAFYSLAMLYCSIYCFTSVSVLWWEMLWKQRNWNNFFSSHGFIINRGLNRQFLKLEAIWFVSGETLGNQDSLLLCTG